MRLTILGSGGFALARSPKNVRQPAGYVVSVGGRSLILDLGFGNLRQMARAGLDPADVTDVFLTHRHPDHVGDLPALLFCYRYEARPKAGVLRLHGPPGLRGFLGGLRRTFHPWLEARGYRSEVRELRDGGRVRGRGWSVEALRTVHPTPALAYRVTSRGSSLVYSGDTGYTPELARFAAGCDLLVLECSTTDRRPQPGSHLTVSEALRVAELSCCKRAVFSHLSEETGRELKRRGVGSGRFLLARDLQEIEI